MSLGKRIKNGRKVLANKYVRGMPHMLKFPIICIFVLLPVVLNLSLEYNTTDSVGTAPVSAQYFPVNDYGFIEDKFIIVSIKAAHDAYLQFFDAARSMCGGKGLSVQIGIVKDWKSAIQCNGAHIYKVGGVLDKTTFKTFWVTFNDLRIKLGRGSKLHTDTLVDFPYEGVRLIQYLNIGTGQFGKVFWKFKTLLEMTGFSSAIFQNVNVTSGIIWHKQSIMAEDCALYCYTDTMCLAYSYNKNNKECQGHDEVYFNIENATSTRAQGVKYFVFQLIDSKNEN